jgi:mediator of RNA polymerase II transcription subunit 13
LKCRPLASVVNNDGPLNPFHKDFINVAQIVAEQLAAGFINGSNKAVDISGSSILSNGVQTDPNATDLKTIMAAVRSCFTTMSHCDLLRWLCVQEAAPEKPNIPKGHPPVPQKKALIPGLQTSDGIQVPMTTLTPLGPPHVRVRRNEGLWDVLPPALPFWEQLGLAPAVGRKNVMAFCVYPGSEDLRSQIGIFMDYLGAAFESCKLGAHVRATQIGAFKDGMVPVQLSAEHTLQTAVRAVREACVELGKTLASINWHSKIDFNPAIEDFTKIDNFVIYMINPFGDNHRGLMELCASFWTLYETYRAAVASPSHKVSRPDVVLQVLPIRYIAGLRAPIIMDSAFFQKLTREVYDRCPPAIPDTTASRLPIESGAAVQLEQPLPRKIDFKLQADPPPDLLHEGSNLHLGYAKSNNGEWVSVAWTDGTGKYQASASYCLVGRRTFIDVARVIWQSTLEIMQARRVAWRLCIARAGFLDKEELDGKLHCGLLAKERLLIATAWSMLATSASSLVMITVITSVDPDPPVSVFHDQPTMSSRPGANVAPQTPVGTPRSGVSPDTVLTPAATPNAETGPDVSNDPDAHLVDIGDETWGLILGHRTNVSSSIADYRPSLSAGYLMKSNTTLATALDDHDEADIRRIVLVGVKLVWIGSSPKPAPAPQQQSQPSPMSFQSSFSALSSSPTDIGAGTGLSIPPTPPETSAPGQQPPGQLNTSTSGSSIPKVTADSILRDYLQMYRNLGVLARARGLRGTKRGALPWHVVVALRAVEGLETSYGTMQANS